MDSTSGATDKKRKLIATGFDGSDDEEDARPHLGMDIFLARQQKRMR